jgi:hypothetical protein
MNKNRQTSHLTNVLSYDLDGNIVLLHTPSGTDDSARIPTTAWVRTYVTGLTYATQSYVSTQLGSYVTLSGQQTITGIKTFSNEQLFGNGITLTGGYITYTSGSYNLTLNTNILTANRNIFLKDGSGTLAFVSDIPSLAGYATEAYVGTAISNLVASAPATLDTLNELAAALGNDASFATTTATALGNRLRIDIGTQGLTSTQQGYGRTNLGLGSLATLSSIGNGYITDLAYSKLTGVPSTFAPSAHTHVWTDITDRPTNLSSFTNGPGYITGITSGMVTTALGYTPYNSSNPSGYITSSASISGNAATATTATNWGSYGGVPAAGTSFGNANTIGRSDVNGYTFFYYINSNTSANENPSISQVIVTNGSDNYYRKAGISHFTSAVQSNASGTWSINVTGSAGSVAWTNVSGRPTTVSSFTNDSGYITSSASISGSAGSVAWGNITGRPGWMAASSLVETHSNANDWKNSGFYENGGGGSNWPSATWYNSVNVRHSNQGNYHGFQVAMSYYDNLLWFRSYQGSGTFQSWVYAISSANIGSQSVSYASSAGNADTVDGYHGSNYLGKNGNSYYQQDTWISINGNHGIYWPSYYGLHLYPNNDGSYGSLQVKGTKNSWHGIHFDSGNTLMMNANESGHHQQGYGWKWRWYNGSMYVSTSANGGGSEYTVVHTGNVGSQKANGSLKLWAESHPNDYYIVNNWTGSHWRLTTNHGSPVRVGYSDDVGNLSAAVGNAYYWSAIQYFETNNGGSAVNNSNSAKLQAYSSSNNSAFMSFHRGGYYAINMGLDNDNVFRIGGWSASGNRLQMDMSGNLTMAGDVTAYSDARVKENIVTVNNALDKVLALRGVYYNRIDSDDKKTKMGVIAQETLQVVPEVVNQDNDGMYNVSYGNLAGLFIEAFKEQQKQIEELKSIINGLTK